MQAHILSIHTFNLWVGLNNKKESECGHVAYQFKGKERSIDLHRSKRLDVTHTPDLWVRLKSDIEIVQISLILIELSTEN